MTDHRYNWQTSQRLSFGKEPLSKTSELSSDWQMQPTVQFFSGKNTWSITQFKSFLQTCVI